MQYIQTIQCCREGLELGLLPRKGTRKILLPLFSTPPVSTKKNKQFYNGSLGNVFRNKYCFILLLIITWLLHYSKLFSYRLPTWSSP